MSNPHLSLLLKNKFASHLHFQDIDNQRWLPNKITIMKTRLIFVLAIALIPKLQAHPSWGISLDKHRNIYFADIGHNGMGSVWKFTNKGELKLLLSDFHAHNVNLDKAGNLITAHGEGTHTMIRILSNGQLDTLHHATNYKAFNGGNCAYTPDGEIIFGISKYIWKIGPDGKKQKVSDHRFEWNQTIYADEEDYIYGPDIGRDNGALIKIAPDGKATVIATNLISKLDRPKDKHNDVLLGITKGCDGQIYICELAGQRVVKIQENVSPITFYKSEGDWFPSAIDFFAGDAYILEFKHTSSGMEGPQLVKIDEAGNKAVLFNYQTYHDPKLKQQTLGKWNPKLLLGGFVVFLAMLLLRFYYTKN